MTTSGASTGPNTGPNTEPGTGPSTGPNTGLGTGLSGVTWRGILFAGVGLTILAILALALEVILIIFAGVVAGVALAEASTTVSRWMRVPRSIVLFGLFLISTVLLGAFLVEFGPALAAEIQTLIDRFPNLLAQAGDRMENTGIGAEILKTIEDAYSEARADGNGQTLLQQTATLLRRAAGFFSSTIGALIGVLAVFAIALYIGAEPSLYRNGLIALVPARRRAAAGELFDRIGDVLAWWFAGQALSMLVLGTLMTVGLWFLDVPFALLFGVFTALMTFIPNLGPVIAAVPVLLVALTKGLDTTLYAGILIVIVQNVEGLILTPLVHRRIIALPPAMVLGALLILGTIAGFIGVLVAMPLTAIGLTVGRFLIEKRDLAAQARGE